jgi:hypothetical protein
MISDLQVTEVQCGQSDGSAIEAYTDRACANCERTGRLWLTFDGARISDGMPTGRWRRWSSGATYWLTEAEVAADQECPTRRLLLGVHPKWWHECA